MKVFKISGTDRKGKTLTRYVKAQSVAAAETVVGLRGNGDSDFISWSTEQIEALPEEALLKCPHCGGDVENPVLVRGGGD